MAENYSIVTDVNAGNSLAVLDQIVNKVMQVESAIGKASGQKLQIDAPGANNMLSGLTSQLSGSKGNFANVGRELGQSLTMGMQQQFGMAGGVATSFASALGPIGIGAAVASAALVGLGAASVNLAKNWQTMMAGVSKTTGVEGAALDALGSKLQDIRVQTGATAESITSAVVTAGSIGIPTTELAEFAQVALQMGSAFSMSSDEAASGIAAIGNSVKPASESWTEFANKAGSSINVLADTMRTSETQIITGMKHLSGTFGLLKPPEDTIPAWEALVATIQSLGLEGDSAGEALKDASTYITRNEKNKISDLLGITGEQLQLDVRSNAPELFQRIALAISNLPLEQQGEALKAFGQSGAQGIGMLMGDIDKTTGGFTKLGAAIKTSEGAWKDATSLSAAYGKSQATLDASLSKLTASLEVAGTKLGTVMLPAITKVVDMLTSGITAATAFGSAIWGAVDTVSNKGLEMTVNDTDYTLDWTGLHKTEQEATRTSAAEMGKQTASVYTDYVNQGIKAGNFDPITGKMKEVGKEAGDVFGEGFLQKLKDAKVSEAIGALIYDAAGNVQMSDDAALSIINSQTGPAKSFKKLSDEFNILGQKWTYLESTTDQSKFKSVVGPQGNVVDIGQARKMYALTSTGQMTTSWGDFKDVGESASESIAKTYYDELKGSIKSSASFMETQYSGMSDDLGNVMADGIFKPMEKRQLEVYDKLLDIYRTEFPLEFGVEEAKLHEEIKAAIKGPWDIDLKINTGELETNFALWIEEHEALYLQMRSAAKIEPMRETEAPYQAHLVALQEQADAGDENATRILSLIETLEEKATSGKMLGSTVEIQKELSYRDPELVKLPGYLARTNTIDAEISANTKFNADGTITLIEKTEDGTQEVVAGVADARLFHQWAMAGGLSNIYNITNNYDYATPSGVSSDFSNAWSNPAYIGKNAGVKGSSWSGMENVFKNLGAWYDQGGKPERSGMAWVNPNDNIFTDDQLACAKSSMYEILENPALFKQTGGIYPTDQGPNYQQLTANVDALNTVLPAATTNVGTLSKSFTWVSDLFFDKDLYDRLTISAPVSGFQSSSKRGQVPVSISEAAKAGMGFRNPFTDETADQHFGMSARIFAAQMAAQGKSQVMPSGAHEEPSWAVKASGGIITKQSRGVLNQMVVERDTLEAVNTQKVRYNDLVGSELRNTLMMSDAALNASAASGQYCEAMSQQGIMIEEQARLAEKNGMFLKGYIGPSKDYEAAKAYFASETVPTIEKNTNAVDYFGGTIKKLDGSVGNLDRSIRQNTIAVSDQKRSDVLAETGGQQTAKWSLSEFDSWVQSSESGMATCYDDLSTWAKWQEGIFGPSGAFKETYLGLDEGYAGPGMGAREGYTGPDYQAEYPDYGPFLAAYQRELGTVANGATVGYLTVDGVTTALDASGMSAAMSSIKTSNANVAENTASTSKSGAKAVIELRDTNKNLVASANANNAVMSNILAATGRGDWFSAAGGQYGSVLMPNRVGTGYGSTGSYGFSSGNNWGSTASSMASSGATSIGSSTWGGGVTIGYAEGGISYGETSITPGGNIFAEKPGLVEAFVPISDRAAGLRILPRVMRELGVPMFAKGGLVGGQSISSSIGPSTINLGGIVIHNAKNMDEKKLSKAIISEVARKFKQAGKR